MTPVHEGFRNQSAVYSTRVRVYARQILRISSFSLYQSPTRAYCLGARKDQRPLSAVLILAGRATAHYPYIYYPTA